jgi:hypothetical protein
VFSTFTDTLPHLPLIRRSTTTRGFDIEIARSSIPTRTPTGVLNRTPWSPLG